MTLLDTHVAVKKLTASGLAEKQAEAIISIVQDKNNNLVTKSDLNAVAAVMKSDLSAAVARIDGDIKTLESKLEAKIEQAITKILFWIIPIQISSLLATLALVVTFVIKLK